jgi:hypothetical protein
MMMKSVIKMTLEKYLAAKTSLHSSAAFSNAERTATLTLLIVSQAHPLLMLLVMMARRTAQKLMLIVVEAVALSAQMERPA